MQSIIRGESPQKAISLLSKKMKTSRYNAGRLIMTESSAIYSASQKDCYKELDVEKYEFVATLDSSTSEICRDMDGKVFDMSDYKVGLTAPPLHCFCRSVTVPYLPDEDGQRIARGEDGKNYYVPANMTYREWEKSFVYSGSKEDLTKIIPNDIEEPIKELTIEDINNKGSNILASAYESHRISNNLTSVPYDDTFKNIVNSNYGKMSVESASAFNDTFEQLISEYDTPLTKIRTMSGREALGNNAFATTWHNYSSDTAEIIINPIKCKDYDKLSNRIKELSESGYAVKIKPELADKYVATHEFAHSLLTMQDPLKNSTNWVNADYGKLKKARKEINNVYDRYIQEVSSLTTAYEKAELEALTSFEPDVWENARNAKKALDSVKISKYSMTNVDEFLAESFTNEKIGKKSNPYAKEVTDILNKYFKR